jgi:hypothetical protein
MRDQFHWARILSFVTGLVNQDLLLRNEYLAAENRILRAHLPARLRLSDAERSTLAEIAKRLGRKALREIARVAKPDTLLAWYRQLVAHYVVESARVDGQPRIVHQAYLGTADKVAALVKDRTSPVPLSAASRDFGLPGALWLAAQQTGLLDVLEKLWPAPRSGPSPARYLLLAAIHRICQPGPKTEVADWYGRTILQSLWGIPPERFTSQAFWDAFEKILPEHLDPLATSDDDPLDRAQLALLDLWKEKQRVSRRLLAYDTTNFYTFIASNNTRNELAQRGHNKQGRHNLRQVGLSYVLDGENGLSLCHHVYRAMWRMLRNSPPRWHACWACWIAARSRGMRSRWCLTKAPRLWPTRWCCKRQE